MNYIFCRYPTIYSNLQKYLKEIYSALQDLVVQEEFQEHIQKDGYGMDEIKEQLRLQENDVMKTEHHIVIAGEYTVAIVYADIAQNVF